jgi:hypothetical protein
MVPIEVLEKLETITELKVIISIFKECSATNSNTFSWSTNDFIDKSGVSRNSVKKAVDSLIENDIVIKTKRGIGTSPNEYKLKGSEFGIKTADPNIVKSWKKSSASIVLNKKGVDELANIINSKELDNLRDITNEFLTKEDINSLSVVNENIYMTDEELGKLANRVFKEVFLPLANVKKPVPPYFFPQQMKLMKDYLVSHRTEQVIAGILYWTTINPTPHGLKSLVFLGFEDKKGKSKLMEALDYYKLEYLAVADEVKAKEMVLQVLAKAEKKKSEEMKEAEIVQNMSDDDFVKNMLGNFGSIKI